MKTSVELPDDLARRIKAAAVVRGRKLKALVAEGLRLVLKIPDSSVSAAKKRRTSTAYEMMKDGCGIVDSSIGDLATNPKHMKRFGRAARRHR